MSNSAIALERTQSIGIGFLVPHVAAFLPPCRSIMTTATSISIGQRFRDVQQRHLGSPALEWVVRDILTGTDGLTYARLVSAGDPTKLKSLSFAVLGDRHRFERIDR